MANNWEPDDISRFKSDEKSKAEKIQKISQTMTAYEFSRFRLRYTQSFSEIGQLKKPELLYDKFIFLRESLKIVLQQLVREGETNEFLKQSMHDLILEKVVFLLPLRVVKRESSPMQ